MKTHKQHNLTRGSAAHHLKLLARTPTHSRPPYTPRPPLRLLPHIPARSRTPAHTPSHTPHHLTLPSHPPNTPNTPTHSTLPLTHTPPRARASPGARAPSSSCGPRWCCPSSSRGPASGHAAPPSPAR